MHRPLAPFDHGAAAAILVDLGMNHNYACYRGTANRWTACGQAVSTVLEDAISGGIDLFGHRKLPVTTTVCLWGKPQTRPPPAPWTRAGLLAEAAPNRPARPTTSSTSFTLGSGLCLALGR